MPMTVAGCNVDRASICTVPTYSRMDTIRREMLLNTQMWKMCPVRIQGRSIQGKLRHVSIPAVSLPAKCFGFLRNWHILTLATRTLRARFPFRGSGRLTRTTSNSTRSVRSGPDSNCTGIGIVTTIDSPSYEFPKDLVIQSALNSSARVCERIVP